MKSLVFILILLAGAPPARAVLPRDADFRQKEVFSYRQRKTAEYEQAHQRREILMTTSDRQVREEMNRSPWGGGAGIPQTGLPEGLAAERQNASSGSGTKWMFPIITLLLIGVGVWRVRVSTETGRNGAAS